MKFIFADSQDFIDPNYDFEKDAYSKNRVIQRTDRYPHEVFKEKVYDGMLVSRAILADGIYKSSGIYSIMQSQRFKREGASKFLRYDGQIFGDCGAFSYVKLDKPPYQNDEMINYYSQCGFTHAFSIDHIIFEYDKKFDDKNSDAVVNEDMKKRFQITQDNAEEFLRLTKEKRVNFEPIGVVQAWSPKSMQIASKNLVAMGYKYIAIGGLVPLDANQCEEIVSAIREVIPYEIKIHLFGFAKANQLKQFLPYNITSFDSTSPLTRAFKDNKFNYFTPKDRYTAIRIPSSDGTASLKKKITSGLISQEKAQKLEKIALKAIRDYDKNKISYQDALDKIIAYEKLFRAKVPIERYEKVLKDKYWQECPCEICNDVGVEVIIFRNSNRNKRRGFHNLWQFMRELETLLKDNNEKN